MKNAASMQEIIDRTLFNFDIFSPKIKIIELHKLALRLKSKNPKEYEYAVTHNGNERGVRDWYSDVSDISHEKAILLCQIENCEWELSLRKEFQFLNILLGVLLIVVYLIVYSSNSIIIIISSLYPLVSIIIDRVGYVYNNFMNIKEGEEINNSLTEIYENIYSYHKQDIAKKVKEIQTCIFERRSKFAPIPDKYYNFRRKFYQKESNEFISDLKKKIKKQ